LSLQLVTTMLCHGRSRAEGGMPRSHVFGLPVPHYWVNYRTSPMTHRRAPARPLHVVQCRRRWSRQPACSSLLDAAISALPHLFSMDAKMNESTDAVAIRWGRARSNHSGRPVLLLPLPSVVPSFATAAAAAAAALASCVKKYVAQALVDELLDQARFERRIRATFACTKCIWSTASSSKGPRKSDENSWPHILT
jgi:hypothetical protein